MQQDGFNQIRLKATKGESPLKGKNLTDWLNLTKEERIDSLNRSAGSLVVVDDWAIVECNNKEKAMIFHLPSGQFRLFRVSYETATRMFSKLSEKDKEKMLTEIIFEAQ